MKINDFVEILNTGDGGKISKILSKKMVEVVLNNGFSIKTTTDKIRLSNEPPLKPYPILPKKHIINLPPPIVDLHVEKLIDDVENLTNAEKIQLQIEVFESKLSAAIAGVMLEITFIHGIGTGVLRKQIHKLLKENEHIKSFQYAQ